MSVFDRLKAGMTYSRLLVFGFLLVILSGAVLLALPISSKSGESTPFIDALFTATSATCVTGLVVHDTFSHWSIFGQTVILALIQIGGIGIMTVISLFFLAADRRIGLHERKLIMRSVGSLHLSGVVRLVRRVIVGTVLIESAGAALLLIRFGPEMGFARGLYYAVFHAISSFCNAGFDLMGYQREFASFTGYRGDPLVVLTLAGLIIVGGVGFVVWSDIWEHALSVNRYTLHTKIVLSATAVLLIAGALGYYWLEYGASMARFGLGERALASFFTSVTTRTAGFSTINMSSLSESGAILTCLLMLTGGSPGSASGGIKTTTAAVLVLGIIHMARGGRYVTIYKRSLEADLLKKAGCIISVYMSAVVISAMVISHLDGISAKAAVFETVSAVATVGLTTGVTPALGDVSLLLLIFLMFAGKLGGFTMMLAFAETKPESPLHRPSEEILVG